MNTAQQRQNLAKAKRIVVKVGTHVLVDKNGRPKKARIRAIAEDIAALHHRGHEVILVSSGAIGAGLQALGMKKRPSNLCDLQMAAAVGQTQLMSCYHDVFTKSRCQISQVLLTHADLKHRTRHLNARNTMQSLLRHRIIPIINENDVVSVDEIRLGDNDILSSLVTTLIDADLLVLLTTPNGLLKPDKHGKNQRVPYLEKVTPTTFKLVSPKQNSLSTGGMATKLQAAQLANRAGAMVVIAPGNKAGILNQVVAGDDVGTLIASATDTSVKKRKLWIGYFHKSQGEIMIDDGAHAALTQKGKSLLPAGIKSINGKFPIGAQVTILNSKRHIIGHGLVEYSSEDINRIKGKNSADIVNVLGDKPSNVVIHRDNLIKEAS